MRRYETTYVLRPNLGESQFTEIIDRTNDIIKNDGGAIIFLDRWGVKKLAYEIRKENHGYYIHFDFAAPATTVQEMERIFRLDDRVLRFLTIKLVDSIDQEKIESEIELAAATAAAKLEDTEISTETEETVTEAKEAEVDDVAEKAEAEVEDAAGEEITEKVVAEVADTTGEEITEKVETEVEDMAGDENSAPAADEVVSDNDVPAKEKE